MEPPTITALRRVLSQNSKKTLVDPSLSPAGVMLLIYPENGEQRILLNRRSDLVEEHKGEIAFPGGRKDESDATLLNTALRETREEMGIRTEDVEVLGELDDEVTPNYLISAFVGTIPQPYRFKPNGREVAEVLEVPVAELSGKSNLRDEARIVEGVISNNLSYAYRGNLIYGATAKLLTRFLELLDIARREEAS